MSSAQPIRYGPFLGVHTDNDERYVQPPYATDSLNTRYEDGSLSPRYGFRNICGAQRYKSTEMDALKLYDRADGIVSDAPYSVYVTVERYGSDTSNLGRLMTVNTTTGARTKVLRNKNTYQKNDIHLGGATGGTYTITVGSSTTVALAWNANDATVQAAIEALATVGAAGVVVTTRPGGHRLSFAVNATLTTATELAVSMTSSLTGTTTTPACLVSTHAKTKSEITQIQVGGATGGSFDFTFYGSTATIPFGATASGFQSLLEALGNINPGDVTVAQYADGFYLSWGGRYLGDDLTQPSIVDNTSGGTGVVIATIVSGQEPASPLIDGTSAVPVLADSYWKILVVDSVVYGFNYAAGDEVPQTSEQTPLWKFTLGDNYSFVAIKPPVAPTDTTQKLAVQYRRQPGSATLGYKVFNWASAGLSTKKDNAVFTAAAVSGVSLDITVAATGLGWLEEKLSALTAGNQNLQYGDCVAFRLKRDDVSTKFDPRTVQVYFKDTNGVDSADGAANQNTTGRADLDTRVLNASADADTTLEYYVFARFPPGKTRTDWAATKYFGIQVNVTATDGTGTISIAPIKIGGMPGLYVPNKDWQAAYAFKDSATGQVSGVGGSITVPHQSLQGDLAFPNFNDPAASPAYLGVIPTLTIVGSSETNVDFVDILLRQQTIDVNPLTANVVGWSQWRQVDEVAESASFTYILQTDASSFSQKPAFTTGVFEYDDIVNATMIHGAVQWLFRKNNRFEVRYSAVGDVLNLVKIDNSDLDILDPGEGANYVFTDKTVDEPVVGFPVTTGCFILGQNGAYAQSGFTPLTMSPVSRIAGSVGCCGADSAKLWRTDDGQSAVVYVSKDANNVFILPAFAVDIQAMNYRPSEYSIAIRHSIRSFLTGGSSLVNTNRMELQIDQRGDAMWIVYVNRVVVYRRKSTIDGSRQWEFYKYNLDAIGSEWLKCHFSEDLGMRCMRINGAMDEVEYDSTDDMAVIEPVWSTPSSVQTTLDRIDFDGTTGHVDPGWPTGAAVVARKSVTNVAAGTTYYAYSTGAGGYKLYDTYANAIAGGSTGRIDLDTTAVNTDYSCGRDDQYRTLGADPAYKAYWISGEHDDASWWNITRTEVDRDNMTDCPTIMFYGDRQNLAASRTDSGGTLTTPVTKTCTVGHLNLYWPKWLRNRYMKCKIVLSENSAPIRALTIWRTPSQRRHRA